MCVCVCADQPYRHGDAQQTLFHARFVQVSSEHRPGRKQGGVRAGGQAERHYTRDAGAETEGHGEAVVIMLRYVYCCSYNVEICVLL